jgi:5-oxoprolinase (ATP-hydrolysing) subunit C
MSLTVLDPGLQSLPVDLGRTGARALGVPLGGAADRRSFQFGNLLLGNPADAVAVEVTLKGPTLRAEVEAVAVVFGAPFVVTVNGREIPPNTTFRLTRGDTLRIGGTPIGCRAYLCTAGGFDVPEVLGSRSALSPLKAGDVLTCGASAGRVGRGIRAEDLTPRPPLRPGEGVFNGKTWLATSLNDAERRITTNPLRDGEGGERNSPGEVFHLLRALPGPQADWFPTGGFFDQPFTVAPASDRMGVRLLGEPIPKRAGELTSEPVAPGAVQVTNDGRPIVLGVDGQTVGGYPKVAHVIRADLDLLGQLRPGDAVCFSPVTADEANSAAEARAKELKLWRLRLELTGV